LTYTLDTNILIKLKNEYPRDIFESIWSALEQAIDDGVVCACTSVLDELDNYGDHLHEWAKTYPGFVCPLTQAEVDLAAKIAAQYEDWARDEKNAADPFVVAHAVTHKRQIVSNESRAGDNVTDRNQKIPNVAEPYGVTTYSLFDWLRLIKWTF